jgi:hypothetical protein
VRPLLVIYDRNFYGNAERLEELKRHAATNTTGQTGAEQAG